MVLIASYLAPVGYALAHLSGPADHAAAAAASLRPVRHRAPACQATAEKIDFSIAVPGKFSRDERMRSRYSGLSYVPEGGWGDDDVAAAGFSYEDMTASMGEITKFSRGETTTGTVIGFEPNGALVDIGVKSSAYCTVREAAPHPFAPLSFARSVHSTQLCVCCVLCAAALLSLSSAQLQEMALVKPDKPENCLEVGAEYEFVVVSREVSVRAHPLITRLLLFIRGGASYERAEISPCLSSPCSPPGRERSADALAAAHPLRPGVGSRGGDVCE